MLTGGCSTSPHTVDVEFGEEYLLSPGIGIGYRVPVGWFDASPDSINNGNDVLLVREDYAASLSVHEIRLDHVARMRLQREGVATLAEMSRTLAASGAESRALTPVSKRNVAGREFFSYEQISEETGDTVIVAVLGIPAKAFEVSGRIAGKIKGKATRDELRAVQDAFIRNLRW